MSLSFSITGLDAMFHRLDQLTKSIPDRAGAALRAEAEIEMTEAKKRTPVLTGALRASGMVTGPVVNGDQVEVTMSFGGAGVDYAVEVHENLEMFHPRGGQAKYLESVVLESAPYMAQRVADRLFGDGGGRYAPTAAEVAESVAAVEALGVDEG
jgi:hypothetical protein